MFPESTTTEPAEGVIEQGAQAQRAVLDIRDRLASLLKGLDAGMVEVQAAPSLWDAFNQVERLGAAGMLLVSKRVEASGVARSAGFRDTADYLARRGGCSKRAAIRQLQASEKLANLPRTAAAVMSGALSADQAAAIADAAAADPEAEPGLLKLASRVSLKELQDACLRIKAKADPDPDKTRRRHQRDRFLRHGRRPDGTFSLYAQGPPEDEGLLQAALRHGIEDRFRAKSRTGGNGDDGFDRYDQRAYDALFDILRTHIAEGPFADPSDSTIAGNDNNTRDDGDDEAADAAHPLAPDLPSGFGATSEGVCERCGCHRPGSCSGGRPRGSQGKQGRQGKRRRRRRQPNPTYTTLVRIDIEALNRGRQEGDEVCDMPGLGPVSVPAVRALLPDSIIRLILTRGQEVAAVVHAGRGPKTAQKMALNWLQPICTVEGCNSQIVQADHRIDWATTGHTTLSQLDHLCPHHHSLKTHKGWALVDGTGKRAFVPPGDARNPHHPPAPQPDDPTAEHDSRHSWGAAA